MKLTSNPAVHALTKGPQHHFFGYYDKSPWDASGTLLLAARASFMDRPPTPDDPLVIGVIDPSGEWTPLAETRAWNWQQGCMLQWLENDSRGEIIFNDIQDDRFISRILNIHTGKERVLERPVYTVSRDGSYGVSLNFSRLHHQRPGYGYAGIPDPNCSVNTPEDDGLYSIDLRTGESHLILSLAAAANFEPKSEFLGRTHRFNHAQFNREGNRFAFLHRYQQGEGAPGHLTRLLTVALDGSALWNSPFHDMVSHYDWDCNGTLIAWARHPQSGDGYHLLSDQSDQTEIIGRGTLTSDGHCSFSPDGKWILTDTYPDETLHRALLLYHLEERKKLDLLRLYSMPLPDEIRCDLHPRWSPCGGKVCIDSTHEGTRQMYLINLEEIL